MHVKYVEAQMSTHWCGVEVRRGEYQLKCRPRHLIMAQNYENYRMLLKIGCGLESKDEELIDEGFVG
ncbi:hypothetical protein TNCV_3584611 [Trichonephila clavipes]|nr:hypothetical protein TNCV_3584611 [Trichonephila clavipes]